MYDDGDGASRYGESWGGCDKKSNWQLLVLRLCWWPQVTFAPKRVGRGHRNSRNLTPFTPKGCDQTGIGAPNLALDPHLIAGYVASAALYAERAGLPRPGSSSWSDFFG